MTERQLSQKQEIKELPLESIKPDPDQPRKKFDEQGIDELAESIKQHGLRQPIEVRPSGDGTTYIIIHGERRFRAHQKAQLLSIGCIITSNLTDAQVRDAQLAENLIREDLTDLELAREFQRRVDLGATHEQIAKAIGKSRGFVTQHLSLLRLPAAEQKQLEKGELTFAEARILASAPGNSGIDIDVKTEEDHGYRVPMEKLEVYRLFQQPGTCHGAAQLIEVYERDLATLRKALHQ